MEIILITYDILHCDPAHQIENELGFSDHTFAVWGMFCRETMLEFLEGSPEKKIGGLNKTVKIDESKISQLKYNRGHPVQGQWVFGSVERQSGRTFFVPVSRTEAPTR